MTVLLDFLPWIVVGIAAFLLIVPPGVKTIRQYERGVQLRFGKYIQTKEPGLRFIIPWVDRLIKVDLRTLTWVLKERQEIITRDNVTVHVDAVVYFNVIDPVKAVLEVEDYKTATEQLALTSLRSVLGQSDLDELLSHRDRVNERLREIIDQHTEDPWGVRISLVEVKDALLPEGMQRIMARQAEAEREKRAKIIHAHGELEAAETLKQAASVIASEPITLQLRYLQTLVEISGEKSSTIIPLPLDVLNATMAQLTANKETR
ncbi:MAG: SPFH domain-containing protein [Gemmatimonadota bacterium]|nr:SPFH domain-containing protein [Gemmatimonadota bacterium]MDH3424762.1 SPFH domain-containing protein [Gemmatimonadota bacterium]